MCRGTCGTVCCVLIVLSVVGGALTLVFYPHDENFGLVKQVEIRRDQPNSPLGIIQLGLFPISKYDIQNEEQIIQPFEENVIRDDGVAVFTYDPPVPTKAIYLHLYGNTDDYDDYATCGSTIKLVFDDDSVVTRRVDEYHHGMGVMWDLGDPNTFVSTFVQFRDERGSPSLIKVCDATLSPTTASPVTDPTPAPKPTPQPTPEPIISRDFWFVAYMEPAHLEWSTSDPGGDVIHNGKSLEQCAQTVQPAGGFGFYYRVSNQYCRILTATQTHYLTTATEIDYDVQLYITKGGSSYYTLWSSVNIFIPQTSTDYRKMFDKKCFESSTDQTVSFDTQGLAYNMCISKKDAQFENYNMLTMEPTGRNSLKNCYGIVNCGVTENIYVNMPTYVRVQCKYFGFDQKVHCGCLGSVRDRRFDGIWADKYVKPIIC